MPKYAQKERAAQSNSESGFIGKRPGKSTLSHPYSGFVSGAGRDAAPLLLPSDPHTGSFAEMYPRFDFSNIRVLDSRCTTMPPLSNPGCGQLQAKLIINQPGDRYEQEADRIAEQIVAAFADAAVSGESPRFQRFAGQSSWQTDETPESVNKVLASPGRSLESEVGQEMGQRFGYDFSRVRVHYGVDAEQSAREMNAHAYTVGNNIVFGEGRFSPATHEGKRLIAHELAHVVQQRQNGEAAQDMSMTAQEIRPYMLQRDLASDIRQESARPAAEQVPGRLGLLETRIRTAADEAFQQQIGGTSLPVGATGRATQIIGHVSQELARLETARALGYQQAVSAIIGALTLSNDQAASFWMAFAGNTLWALSGLLPLLGPVVNVYRIALAFGGDILRVSAVASFLTARGGAIASSMVGLAGAEMAQFSGGVPASAPNLPQSMQDIQTTFTNINSRLMARYRSEAFALTLEFLQNFTSFIDPAATGTRNPDSIENIIKGCVMETLFADLNQEGILNTSNYTIDAARAQQSAKEHLMNKIADVWFANQVSTIGLGARGGVLQIQLADRFPDSGTFRIIGGNIVGQGADIELLRHQLANRPLESIGAPKVIRMNGSMGYGVLPSDFHIIVSGEDFRPSIRANTSRSGYERYTEVPQRVVGFGGHPSLGIPWLAAFHLRLNDLSSDDPRNTPANQSAGAQEIWEQIKNMGINTIGNSSW